MRASGHQSGDATVNNSVASQEILGHFVRAPKCRCDNAMDLSLIIRRKDSAHVYCYRCKQCNRETRVSVWCN
jgi:hypothetical protein